MGSGIDQETFDAGDYARFQQRLTQCLTTLGRLTVGVAVVSVLLGLAYNLVPLAWFGLHRLLAGPPGKDATPAAGR